MLNRTDTFYNFEYCFGVSHADVEQKGTMFRVFGPSDRNSPCYLSLSQADHALFRKIGNGGASFLNKVTH